MLLQVSVIVVRLEQYDCTYKLLVSSPYKQKWRWDLLLQVGKYGKQQQQEDFPVPRLGFTQTRFITSLLT